MWVCMCVFKWTPIQIELNRELNPCNTYLFGEYIDVCRKSLSKFNDPKGGY